ncbi:MAG: DPP IV N-terminal domain-containing protein [Cyclobacteriaceae bacterium]|nr:DPP IV N-terminal domain-containing protein [Cyclobacteriaceae bacterium]
MKVASCETRKLPFHFLLILITLSFSCTEKREVTLEDYQRAEKFLAVNTNPLVYGMVSSPEWQKSDWLIYKNSVPNGAEFIRVDPQAKSKEKLFDHEKVAALLSDLSGEEVKPLEIELSQPVLSSDQLQFEFSFKRKRYVLNLSDYTLNQRKPKVLPNEYLSPDGLKAAYIKDYNLWIRDTQTNNHTQLTFDGKEDYGYATNNAGWTKRDSPVLLWSPQSDKIATFQHDGRGVGEMYLYNTQVGHSKLERWKYPLPGDSLIFRIERVVIHLTPKPKLVRLKMQPDAHRSTISDHIAGRDGQFLDVEWSDDGSQLAFVSSSRDHKVANLQVADPNSGDVRSVLVESVETYFESGNRMVNWHVLKETDEVIWFSERNNWGHLYLFDLKTGTLKNQITDGEWAVQQVHHIDKEARTIYFIGSNKEEGDPYYQYLYKINFDGTGLQLLTPEPANHVLTWSASRKFILDSYSTPTTPPVTVIRSLSGEVIMKLEEADITALENNGWVAPIPFSVKARDNSTDLFGLMYKPSNFSSSKKYPILNYLYPGPQSGSVGSRSFMPSRGDKQALAELGFIVVEVDAMGTPGRSKSFHDAYYGNMGDNGLPDQIAAIKQLAEQNTWMDIDRVGIWGHSGGGFASTAGILRYPDFYKVAVSGAGNHDNRNYEDDWGEKWHGLLVRYSKEVNEAGQGESLNREVQKTPEETNYDRQANQLLANNLKGKLLIAHGMMDGNVPPTNTLLVVDALIAADKDFDMLVLPNAGHGFGNSRYFMKRRWDYFVRHLKDAEPPADFIFKENIR